MASARIIADARQARRERYKRADETRTHLTTALQTLGSTLDRDLRARLSTLHANAGALDAQTAQLRGKTERISKTTRQWGAMADNARGRLKEVGDVQNWAEMIEAELAVLEECLRIVEEGEGEGGR